MTKWVYLLFFIYIVATCSLVSLHTRYQITCNIAYLFTPSKCEVSYNINTRIKEMVIQVHCTKIIPTHALLIILVQRFFKKGKDYAGAKFFYTEPISLNKAHSTRWKAFDNKTLHLYNHSLFKILIEIDTLCSHDDDDDDDEAESQVPWLLALVTISYLTKPLHPELPKLQTLSYTHTHFFFTRPQNRTFLREWQNCLES